MKKLLLSLCVITLSGMVLAQIKNLGDPAPVSSPVQADLIDLRNYRQTTPLPSGGQLSIAGLTPLPLQILKDDFNGGVIYGEQETPRSITEMNEVWAWEENRGTDIAMQYLTARAEVLRLSDPQTELRLVAVSQDVMRNQHLRYSQQYRGLKVYNGELIVHTRNNYFNAITGHWYPTPSIDTDHWVLSESDVHDIIAGIVDIKPLSDFARAHMPAERIVTRRVIYYPCPSQGSVPRLAYAVEVHPHFGAHLHFVVDAGNGEVLRYYEKACRLISNIHRDRIKTESADGAYTVASEAEVCDHGELIFHDATGMTFVSDGDVMASGNDLGGINRNFHVYQIGPTYYMIDASQQMFNPQQSMMPDNPHGAIWTINGNNTSPESQNFNATHVFSPNNTWNALSISAHWNGFTAYDYFLTTHGRNAINGSGGTIVSFINVSESDGSAMDNAFWYDRFIFYGNGNVAFSSPLAKGLDVAGHEMSHGVIQSTANLEYIGQSGALNESFADVFGAMIDRDNWQIGEAVVNPQFFLSGAMRDMSNPHNGGTSLNHNGWQPAHMNEYQNLPLTPQGDFGGVHINSGIPNHAFYLFATNVGKDVAEHVYYHALSNYLVKSSQFIDCRIAVIRSAQDLYPGQPQIAQAAANAFTAVGIGEGQGGSYEEDIDVNPGRDFILLTDEQLTGLYIVYPETGNVQTLTGAPAPYSRPSITDDGSFAVYVDQQRHLKGIIFDWSGQQAAYEIFDLETNPQPIWRSIAVSRDGARVAFLTEDLDDLVYLFDFDQQIFQVFALYNPTTGGVSAGGVLYADVLEWDHSGQFLMYDALNEIPATFGDGILYWDISFLHAWDNAIQQPTEGVVYKLFSGVPTNISIGNATFSKNSPYIVAFDYLETEYDLFGNPQYHYHLLTANIERGIVVDVLENNTLSYPSFSRLDDFILFDAYHQDGTLHTAFIQMQPDDKMQPVPGSATLWIPQGHWAIWGATGTRSLTGTDAVDSPLALSIFPNPSPGSISFFAPDATGTLTTDLFDNMGRLITSRTWDSVREGQVMTWDLSDVSSGVYVLVATSRNMRTAQKVSIVR